MKPIKRSDNRDRSSQPDPDKTGTTDLDTGTAGTAITDTENRDLVSGGTEPVSTPESSPYRPNSKLLRQSKTIFEQCLRFFILVVIPIQLIKCTFRADPTIPRSAIYPQESPSTDANNSKSNGNCAADLPARMKQANITDRQIDVLFAQKHPERQDKKISDRPEDAPLRKEWCNLAEQEISTKKK
jgi:hypothetical protein